MSAELSSAACKSLWKIAEISFERKTLAEYFVRQKWDLECQTFCDW